MADFAKDDEPEVDDTEKLLNLVSERYDKAVKAQMSYITMAEECRLYFRGDQWLVREGSSWRAAKDKPWRVRLTINKILPAVESAISTITSKRPIIIANAATDEDADRKASKVTEKVLSAYWEKLDMETSIDTLFRWVLVAGNGFSRVQWDPTAGPTTPKFKQIPNLDPNTMMPVVGGPDMIDSDEVEEVMPNGDVVVDIFSPFQVAVEPGATSLKDAKYFFITELLLKDEVESKYDVDLEDEGQKSEDSRVRDGTFAPKPLDASSDKDNEDRVVIFQMYEKPTRKLPNGRLYTCTKYTELARQDLPKGEHRVVQFKDIDLPGEFEGTSRVSQAIPPQTEYNKIRSQMIEDRRLMGRPKVFAPEGSLNQQEIDNQPGQVVLYDPLALKGASPPHYERGPGTNPSNFQEIQVAAEEINDMMSRHDASQGATSSNINSGIQAQRFQAADNSAFGPTIRRMEKGLAQIGKFIVSTIKENMEDERIMPILGENHAQDFVKFKKDDITDVANIRYEIASQLPWDREGLRQQLFWMYSQQLVDREQLLKMVDMPLVSSIYETDQTERTNAQKENVLLEMMTFAPVETDNHKVHMEEHVSDVNLPENRERIIQYGAQNNGARPTDIMNKLQHLEGHRKAIPPPPAPPAQPKVIVSAALPPQESIALAQQYMGPANPAQQTHEEPGYPSGGGGMATPPGGGLSGETYGGGPDIGTQGP